MKKLFLLSIVLFIAVFSGAQSRGFNYKALITDNGSPVVNHNVTIRFTILQDNSTTVYQEEISTTTDNNGIVSAIIGHGTVLSGDFPSIDWGNGSYYLKVEIDSGNGFMDFGTNEMQSVPYAKYAKNVDSIDYSRVSNPPVTFLNIDDNKYPTDIHDEIYHNGPVIIGDSVSSSFANSVLHLNKHYNDGYLTTDLTSFYSASRDNEYFGNYNLISSDMNDTVYGSLNELKITSSEYNKRIGYGTILEGSGIGEEYGMFNTLKSTGTGTQYGVYNLLTNDESGGQYGTYSRLEGTGTGTHYGNYTLLTGNGTGDQYGTYNFISNNKDGDHYGVYNTMSGNGTGKHYGVYNKQWGSGSGKHYGVYNEFLQDANGDQYGIYNNMHNSGYGYNFGMLNNMSGDSDGEQYGICNTVTNSGDGYHFGIYSDLLGNGTNGQTGVYNNINASTKTNETNYGTENYIYGTGNGVCKASYNVISNSGTGEHVTVHNELRGHGSGPQYGVKNKITNTGSGSHFGTYNSVSGSGGTLYGTYNEITGTVGDTSSLYGTYNYIPADLPGEHFAVYGNAIKPDSYAGYFVGDVMITSKLVTATSAGADMKAYAYGFILKDGTVEWDRSSHGFYLSKSGTGVYEIILTHLPSDDYHYIVNATAEYGTSGIVLIMTDYAGAGAENTFYIRTFNLNGAPVNCSFHFVVYRK